MLGKGVVKLLCNFKRMDVLALELPPKITKILSQDRWYHATTMEGYYSIRHSGILVDYNKGSQLDFGFGFYLTTTRELAESFIGRVFNWKTENYNETPVIMEYQFCPLEWFVKSSFCPKVFPSFNDEFAEFVFYNRVENASGERQHPYDVIYGVMSDSVPTVLITEYLAGTISKEMVLTSLRKDNRMKQISLHNQKLCDIIVLRRAYMYNPLTQERKELNLDE